jgi:flavin reductase (NADH)/flavin reductase/chlorophenol-4-monooxygenase component 1
MHAVQEYREVRNDGCNVQVCNVQPGNVQLGNILLEGMGTAGAPQKISSMEFREALSKVASAVTVVSTDGPCGAAGFTCSAVCAVADSPPTIVVCVNRKSAANTVIKGNGVLCVNSLRADQVDLSQLFSGVGRVPMRERFADHGWKVLATGAPCCEDSLVALDCRVVDVREIGTHSVFLAEVLATAHGGPADPLIYHRRSYATTRLVG